MSKELREIAEEAAKRDRSGGTSTGDWSPLGQADLDRCVDLAFIRGYIAAQKSMEEDNVNCWRIDFLEKQNARFIEVLKDIASCEIGSDGRKARDVLKENSPIRSKPE